MIAEEVREMTSIMIAFGTKRGFGFRPHGGTYLLRLCVHPARTGCAAFHCINADATDFLLGLGAGAIWVNLDWLIRIPRQASRENRRASAGRTTQLGLKTHLLLCPVADT